MLKNKQTPTTTTSTLQPPAHPNISKAALAAIRCSHGHRPPSKPNFSFGLVTSTPAPLCPSQTRPPLGRTRRRRGPWWQLQWWPGSRLSRAGGEGAGAPQRVPALCSAPVTSVGGWDWLPTCFFFFFLPWKSKSGSWVGREPAKMNSNEPISIEIGSLPCQRLIKPNALNSLQQTRCCRQCPPSCLQEITHNFKIKRIKIQVGVYSYVHTYVPLQGRF